MLCVCSFVVFFFFVLFNVLVFVFSLMFCFLLPVATASREEVATEAWLVKKQKTQSFFAFFFVFRDVC